MDGEEAASEDEKERHAPPITTPAILAGIEIFVPAHRQEGTFISLPNLSTDLVSFEVP
jgi:hypothetical protein